MQLRFGGKVAVTHEKYVGIPWRRIPDIARQVDVFIKRHKYAYNDTLVYISSDARNATSEFRRIMNPSLLVIDSPLFSFGHSDKSMDTSMSHISIVNRVMTDLYFMDRCDYLFVTWQSSLGRIMCNMKEKNSLCGRVLNLRSVDKKRRIT